MGKHEIGPLPDGWTVRMTEQAGRGPWASVYVDGCLTAYVDPAADGGWHVAGGDSEVVPTVAAAIAARWEDRAEEARREARAWSSRAAAVRAALEATP